MKSEQMTKEDLEGINIYQYQEILNSQIELIFRANKDYVYVFINDAYCNYFGINREDLIGKKKISHIYEEDHKKIYEALRLASIDNPFINIKTRCIKSDGSIDWVEWTGCVFYNESGEITSFQGVGRDITHRKKGEDELKKLQNELEMEIEKRTCELKKVNKELTLINSYMNSSLINMSEGIAIIDELGNFKNLNPAFEKNWGDHTKEIKEYLKKIILKEKNDDIYKMLHEKKSFYGSELIIPIKKENLQFFISGDPIEYKADNVRKGVIVIRPIQEVHKLVNRFSGSQARYKFSDIITKNKDMLRTVETARRASLGDGNILIQGESGTGKELFAQAIHNHSKRCNGPFIAVNCGAIPRDLIGSELFGYTEGSFTGAKRGGKPGKFELASGGTIFLDEIGDMPFEQQVAILRVIQEKKIMRIGGEQEISIDMHIICATNKNLYQSMKEGSFREDLYYRLNVIFIKIPSLRERREDIFFLFEYFIKQMSKNWSILLKNMDPLVREYLTKYNWYGNVRELQNIVERIVHIVQDEFITIAHLPENMLQLHSCSMDKTACTVEEEITIKDIVEQERKIQEEQVSNEILKLLKQYRGNISQVARIMGISRSTLYRKMKTYKIEKDI